ncbi:MAG: hypothetical protein PUB63_05310 [Clostridia bacterium]|nr:hypothetical protein [Clostridia bacterium]
MRSGIWDSAFSSGARGGDPPCSTAGACPHAVIASMAAAAIQQNAWRFPCFFICPFSFLLPVPAPRHGTHLVFRLSRFLRKRLLVFRQNDFPEDQTVDGKQHAEKEPGWQFRNKQRDPVHIPDAAKSRPLFNGRL